MAGTTIEGRIDRVTDGDTLRIMADGRLFKVRVLGLDTEESMAGGGKPVTDWGKAASDFARSILPEGTPVTIEFPGSDPVIVDDEINVAYLDNFERPLGFIQLTQPVDGIADYSELMIRKGFSPYFVKYGRAVFAAKDAAYAAAERAAQIDDIGVWNQFAANGAMRPEDAPRNYPRLMVWWELRARTIDAFRAARAAAPAGTLLNTRLDYAALAERAADEETVTVFMELTEGFTVGGIHHVIRSGSRAQPFKLFLPDEDSAGTQAVLDLLRNRYIADGEDFPRRNYAYVTGALKLFGGEPEMVVTDVEQVSDHPPGMIAAPPPPPLPPRPGG